MYRHGRLSAPLLGENSKCAPKHNGRGWRPSRGIDRSEKLAARRPVIEFELATPSTPTSWSPRGQLDAEDSTQRARSKTRRARFSDVPEEIEHNEQPEWLVLHEGPAASEGKGQTLLPRIDKPKRSNVGARTEFRRLGSMYYVDESAKPGARSRSRPPPAQSLAEIRTGKRHSMHVARAAVRPLRHTSMDLYPIGDDSMLQDRLSELRAGDRVSFGSTVFARLSLDSPAQSRGGTPMTPVTIINSAPPSHASPLLTDACLPQSLECYGAGEALDRMADYAIKGGILELLGETERFCQASNRLRLRTANTTARSRQGTAKSRQGTACSPEPSTRNVGTASSQRVVTPQKSPTSRQMSAQASEGRRPWSNLSLASLGEAHAAMAAREGTRGSAWRPSTRKERDEEEALYTIMVGEFPKGWTKEAAGHVGKDVWVRLTARQKVGIVHALLADVESALPLIKTMKVIYETVESVDSSIGDVEKRAKYKAKTGISALDNDVTVQIETKEMQDLMMELLYVAVKCNQMQRAVTLLESIDDTSQRDGAAEALFQMSDDMLSHQLRELLQQRGFVSGSERRQNARTPRHPSRTQLIPEVAQMRLKGRQQRSSEAVALEAARKKTLDLDNMVSEALYADEDFEDEDDENDIENDMETRKVTAETEGIVKMDQIIDIYDEAEENGGLLHTEEDIADPMPADAGSGFVEDVILEDCEKHSMGVDGLPVPVVPQWNPEDYVNKEDYGILNDPTLIGVQEESSDDEELSIFDEFSPNHPVIAIFGKIMNRSKALMFGIWKYWASERLLKRLKIRDQYLSNCNCAKVTPAGVQPLLRYMLASSRAKGVLVLSKQSFSQSTMKCLLEAMVGFNAMERSYHEKRPGCFPEWANINELRKELSDNPMTELDLSYNDLQLEGFCVLRDALLNPECSWHVSALRLDANHLREKGATALIPLLRAHTSILTLQHLSIAKNDIGDKGLAMLVEALNSNMHLLSLNISNNAASFRAATALGKMLADNDRLQVLDCSYNMIRSDGAVLLAQGLAENTKLREINLSWNGFGDAEPCEQLAAAIENSYLKKIDLGYNRILMSEAVILASYLERCKNIRNLVLDGNMISQAGARLILQATKKAAEDEGEEFSAEVSMKQCGIGIVDHAAFDPSEPSGEYELDLKDRFSQKVMLSLLRIVAQGKGIFLPLDATEADLPKVTGAESHQEKAKEMNAMYAEAVTPIKLPPQKKDKSGKKGKKKKGNLTAKILLPPLVFKPYCIELPCFKLPDGSSMVNPDESEWHVPKDGVIRFKFASTSVGFDDTLGNNSLNQILATFCDKEKSHSERIQSLQLHLGPHTAIKMAQAKQLLEALAKDEHDKLREKDLVLTRSALVIRCFHRLVETDEARDLLDLLDAESRKFAAKALGAASFSFTRNNATGNYRLNFEDPVDRELCLRLVECYNEQRLRLKQLDLDNDSRVNGLVREKPERVWRNLKVNGKPFVFDPSWRIPHTGRMQVDFVVIKKPQTGSKQIPNDEFRTWCVNELDEMADKEDEVVNAIRVKSNNNFFSCDQLVRLLGRLKLPAFRVELCVIAFARTIDFHNFKYVLEYLTVGELASVQVRIGLTNLWDESMAVGFYDLDLANPEHRWLCQELLVLNSEESGGRIIETCYEMVDFDVPSSWLREMPSKGLFQCYYVRDFETVKTVRDRGTVRADRISPSSWDAAAKSNFDAASFSHFMPAWLKKYVSSEVGDAPLHEPAGREWIQEHRLRRIQTRLYEAFGDVERAMEWMDKDFSGEVEVHELVESLRIIHVWLNANQLSALLSSIDPDGSGTISQEELKKFWMRFASEWQSAPVVFTARVPS